MSIYRSDAYYSDKLKKLRKQYRIKQQAMVDYLDLKSQQQYSDLENGKKHFTDEIIIKICAFFHISILQFTEKKEENADLKLILNSDDYKAIENLEDNDTKLIIYKKLFLESKIEMIENKLKSYHKEFNHIKMLPPKYKVYVII